MNIWFFNHYAVPTSLYPLARPYHFANHLQQKGHKVTIFAASSVHLSDKNLITDGRQMKAKRVDGIRYVFLKARNYEGNGLGRILNFFDYTIRLFTQTGKFNKPDVIMATSVHPLTCVAGIILAMKSITSTMVWILASITDSGKRTGCRMRIWTERIPSRSCTPAPWEWPTPYRIFWMQRSF